MWSLRKGNSSMPIPDFQKLMLPLLEFASDDQEHYSRDAVEMLAQQFNLTDAEREELLPSATDRRFNNRVHWALTYLRQAGLLESTRRGYFQITTLGRQIVQQRPPRVDIKFLTQFPAFVEFREPGRRSPNGQTETIPLEPTPHERTPEELLEFGYQAIRQALAAELLSRVKACSWSFFERLVVELLVKMGYGGSRKDAGEAVGRSGDEGIDGIIKEDRLGLDIIYIQAKKWEGVVGRPEIQKFVGALHGQRARKGIVITTSSFSRDAEEYVKGIESKIVLIDGQRLSELMIDHDVGVTAVSAYQVKRIDSDYFAEV
jgi:restriction system protein